MTSTAPAVVARGLIKTYGKTRALDGFDLTVARGAVCGLLGPNGAGKTTAVRILTTLLRPDGGSAEVAGIDVATEPALVRTRIGMIGQQTTVDDILTGRENLLLWCRLYHLSEREAQTRSDQLLEHFGLTEAGDKQAKHYSGGMRRRLDLAASFVLTPQVLFLDEPTTGLDPRNRNEVWSALRGVVALGTTVLMTTQYLDEADQLADQVVVIDHGRVIADGPPAELKATIGGDRIDVVLRDEADLFRAAEIVARAAGVDAEVEAQLRRVSAPARHRVSVLSEVIRNLEEAQIDAEDVNLRRPTLDEVFLRLTGRRADDSGDTGDSADRDDEPVRTNEEVAV